MNLNKKKASMSEVLSPVLGKKVKKKKTVQIALDTNRYERN
jgi:hypothetical protein